MTRAASGPVVNYDDPNTQWDQLEGLASPAVLADVADLNADVRGLSENYRDPAGAIQQDKAAGGDTNGRICRSSTQSLAVCCIARPGGDKIL
jgi:hypothetical protein